MKKYIIFLVLISITRFGFGVIFMNDIVCSFIECVEKEEIKVYMTDGASNFLKANAETMAMLSLLETSGLSITDDSTAELAHLNNAIKSIDASLVYFKKAFDIGKRIGFSQNRLNLFYAFNFDELISSRSLNSEIAQELKFHLSKGNVLAVYQLNINRLIFILADLNSVKTSLEKDKKVSRELCWALIQKYSECALFGNYATQFGVKILEHCSPDVE